MKILRSNKKVALSTILAIFLGLCVSFVGNTTVQAGGADGGVYDYTGVMDPGDEELIMEDLHTLRSMGGGYGINLLVIVMDDVMRNSSESSRSFAEDLIQDYNIDDESGGIVTVTWSQKDGVEVFASGPATSTFTDDAIEKIENHYKGVKQKDVSATMSSITHDLVAIAQGNEPEYFAEEITVEDDSEEGIDVDTTGADIQADDTSVGEQKSSNVVVWVIIAVLVVCVVSGIIVFLKKKK